jgi:hypothetical protein
MITLDEEERAKRVPEGDKTESEDGKISEKIIIIINKKEFILKLLKAKKKK